MTRARSVHPWLVAATLLTCSVAPRADAASRTFVSVTGNDLSDCAVQETPCRTLSAAVAQVDPAGEVLVLASGPYGGATIKKSVRIDAPPGIVAFAASGIVVAAEATDTVVVRGLTLSALTPGSGFGVDVQSAKAVFVENCVIDGWQQGINVLGTVEHVFVSGTTVRGSSSDGLRVLVESGEARVAVSHSRFDLNGNCGVSLGQGTTGIAADSVAARNSAGFCASGAGATLNLVRCTALESTKGLVVSAGALGRIASSSMSSLENEGGTLETMQNNLVFVTTGTITPVSGS